MFKPIDVLLSLGPCFEEWEQDIILDNVTKKTGLKLYIFKDKEKNNLFFNFISSYNGDFVRFANDFIEDEKMRNKFISFCQKKRLDNLFDN